MAGRAQQIPAITGDIDEHRDLPIGLNARLGHKVHAGRAHSSVRHVKVIDTQKEADAPGALPAHLGDLLRAVGARQ
jgi:hypothetical protein